jgi:putative ATP-dependent endonuclease of OLD family
MSNLDISFKIKNYKCFRDEFVGFDKIKPVNIIIGRNNSGKSSMLDILEFLTTDEKRRSDILKDGTVFQFEDEIREDELKSVFRPGTYGGDLLGSDWWENHGKMLLGLRVVYKIPNSDTSDCKWLNPDIFKIGLREGSRESAQRQKHMDEFLIGKFRIPKFFQNKLVIRLHAERDIRKESYAKGILDVEPNGNGVTNVITSYIHYSKRDRDLIQKELLESLNRVFSPDCLFDEITTRIQDDDTWEVYLKEKQKGLVPLSKSGSGLKTVILVLLNMLVVPKIARKDIGNYIFAFEELENNLHPALLRRLFRYIEDFAIQNKCHFFITTHSNVVVDQFSQSPNAQIIHVVHNGIKACATTINSFKEHSAVLDDLGSKASDLLQANGIIWLEGPSDRTYFNKWVELYSECKLKEHRDYECAFYGGSLLAHFESKEPLDSDVDAVNILRVNRNAILIGDSDKTSPEKHLKLRLEKMKTAMEEMGAYIWVTDAKEIENYIPAVALNKIFQKDNLPEIEQYEIFYHEKEKDYWHKNELTGSFDKVEFAHKVVPHLLKEDLDKRFKLKERLAEICKKIEQWNKDRPTIKQD